MSRHGVATRRVRSNLLEGRSTMVNKVSALVVDAFNNHARQKLLGKILRGNR